MECKDLYVERITEKYNRQQVRAFIKKNAEKKFLGPFDLKLQSAPPLGFGNNINLLNREEEFKLFSALHFIKYKLYKLNKPKNRCFSIYIALRNRAISANWGLVPTCIEKHTRKFHRADLPTLMEKGNESLISAVDCFDPWRGYRFCTYAWSAIMKSFLRKPPNGPTTAPIDDKLADSLADDQIDNDQELWTERLEAIMKHQLLTMREKEVLMYRFGCFGYKINNNKERLTLKEVAENWGMTKERVRQIQVDALCKLREELQIDPILH